MILKRCKTSNPSKKLLKIIAQNSLEMLAIIFRNIFKKIVLYREN